MYCHSAPLLQAVAVGISRSSSATPGTNSQLVGTVLAAMSITATSSASMGAAVGKDRRRDDGKAT